MRTAVTIYRCVRVSAASDLLHTQAMFGLRADMTRAHDACCRNFLSMRYVCDSAFAMECGAHTGLRTCARLPPQVSARSRSRSRSGSGSGSLFISCVRRRTQYQPRDYLSRALAMHVRSHNVGNYGGFTIFWSVCPALGTSFEASSMTTNLFKNNTARCRTLAPQNKVPFVLKTDQTTCYIYGTCCPCVPQGLGHGHRSQV